MICIMLLSVNLTQLDETISLNRKYHVDYRFQYYITINILCEVCCHSIVNDLSENNTIVAKIESCLGWSLKYASLFFVLHNNPY